MNHDQAGGTPPQIWRRFKIQPALRGRERIRMQVRIIRLCMQVEKLSWMLEWIDDYDAIEEAERQWTRR